jgi:O-antigen ligase
VIRHWTWANGLARSTRATAGGTFLRLALGVGVALVFVTTSGPLFAIAGLALLAMLVFALAAVSEVRLPIAAGIAALAGTFAITVHHSPGITLLEALLILPAGWLAVTRLGTLLLLELTARRFLRLFVAASAGLLLLGALYVVYRPAGGHAGTALKELGKNVELVVLTLGLLAWISDRRRLAVFYGFAAAVFFIDVFAGVVRQRGDVIHLSSLQTTAPLLLLVLLVPFVRRRQVLPLVGFALVLLVVAKTRQAWAASFVVVAIAILTPQLRASLGRRLAASMGIAVGVLVLVIVAVPTLRARADSVFTGHDQSTHDRFAMAHAAQLELQKHPLTGVGPGEFKHWLLAHPPPFDFWIGLEVLPLDPHNAFAKFGAELGVPGLILFLCWVVGVLGIVLAYRREALELPELRLYAAGIVLFAVLYLFVLGTSEWGAISRFELPLGAALLMSLGGVVPASRRSAPAGVGSQ